MKKRAVMAAMVAALVLSQATTAFAAGSDSAGGSARVNVDNEISITLNGNTTTPNYGGEASNGATSVAFVKGETHAVAGLPNGIVDTINAINRNKADLANVGTGLDLKGYNALIGTHAIMTYQAGTKVEKTGDVSIDLYVPNLVDGLGDVEVLFYNNMTGRWQLIKPASVNTKTKVVTVTIPNSGTISVIYKK